MQKPNINVTPLIDVLLVLLIIFMVVAPIRPSAFKAKIPSESNSDAGTPHPHTLVVAVDESLKLRLNNDDAGSVDDPSKLTTMLRSVFDARIQNGAVSETFADAADRPFADRIERTVFIKAPATVNYGNVVKVIDAAKVAGAFPLSLQIDRL